MTLYAYDCEFLEDGRTIELISIGIVCEDGREYYAVNAELPEKGVRNDPWLMENVVPGLPKPYGDWNNHMPKSWLFDYHSPVVKPRARIAVEVREFLLAGLFLADDDIELWADCCAYDHVALAQLWGRMVDLPNGVPMYTNDLQQALRSAPDGFVAPEQAEGQHNALADARHVLTVLDALRAADQVDIVADGRVIRSEAA